MLLTTLLTSLVLSQAADTQLKVAVPDFASPAGQEGLGVMLSGVVGHELERLGLFKVTTAEQVRVVLSNERQKALMGCVDESCGSSAVNAASMLGVDLLVTGRLTKLGAKKGEGQAVALDLTLLDAKTGGRKGSTLVNANSESELIGKISEAVVSLVGKVLEGKQGALVITSSELGASVKIDGTIVGTTPLEGRLALTAGPHSLRIEKDSFVTVQKEVRISPDKVTEESVRMVPSPDFAAAYEQKENRLRLGTWLAGGLSVVGVGLFAVMQNQASTIYGTVGTTKTDTFVYQRAKLIEGVETELIDPAKPASPENTINHRTQAGDLKARIESAQTISYVGIGLGIAAAITGVALEVISDDPGKYRQYKQVTVPGAPAAPAPAAPAAPKAPKASLLIFPGGGALGLSGEF